MKACCKLVICGWEQKSVFYETVFDASQKVSLKIFCNIFSSNKATPYSSTQNFVPSITEAAYLNQNLIRNVFLSLRNTFLSDFV